MTLSAENALDDKDVAKVGLQEHQLSAAERKKVEQMMNVEDAGPMAYRKFVALVGSEKVEELSKGRCTGPLVILMTSRAFDWVMNTAIFLNCICMGMEADRDKYSKEVQSLLSISEDFFLALFTVELVLSGIVFGKAFLQTAWGSFDMFIVAVGLTAKVIFPLLQLPSELKIVLSFRILRLLRIARAIRMVPQFRILWMLVRGLWSAMQTLLWAAVLMVAVIYTFAIVAVEVIYSMHVDSFVEDQDPNMPPELLFSLFGTVPRSMLTLLQITTQDSWAIFVRPLVIRHWYLILYFAPFIGVMIMAVMNLVTAIIVETSMQSAKADRDAERKYQMKTAAKTLAEVEKAILSADQDGSGDVTKQEMLHAYTSDSVVRLKVDSVIDVTELMDLFDIFDDDGDGELSFVELRNNFLSYKADPIKSLLLRKLRILGFIEHNVAKIVGFSIAQSRAAFRFDRGVTKEQVELRTGKAQEEGCPESDQDSGQGRRDARGRSLVPRAPPILTSKDLEKRLGDLEKQMDSKIDIMKANVGERVSGLQRGLDEVLQLLVARPGGPPKARSRQFQLTAASGPAPSPALEPVLSNPCCLLQKSG